MSQEQEGSIMSHSMSHGSVSGVCAKCQRQRRVLYPYKEQQWCGTCISREERRINTHEMYGGHGRRGY